MVSLKKMALGAALAVGALAAAATPANAAVRVFIGGPRVAVGYIPPCPGAGYVWAPGYYANGVWIGGRWNFAGARGPVFVDRFHRGFYDRGFYGHERFRR